MKGREALALASIAAVSSGAVHAGLQYDTMASARAQAITIEACGQAYDTLEAHGDASHGDGLNTPVDFATLADWHSPETGGQDAAVEATQILPLAPGNYVVSRETIQCLQEGWVQGGGSVDTSNINVGESELLLKAFATLEKSRGRHFDPSSAILWGVAAGLIVGLLTYPVRTGKERDQREEARSEEDVEAAEEVRRRGIFDYENLTDEDPAEA